MPTIYETAFTEKVAELIAQGYTINTHSMAGHQGEIAKVCFTKGGKYYALYLDHRGSSEFTKWDTVDMVFGEAEGDYSAPQSTMWLNSLKEISRQKFYCMGDFYTKRHKFFTADPEAAEAAAAKRRARFLKSETASIDLTFNEKALTAAYRYIKREVPGYKMLRKCQITSICIEHPYTQNRISVKVHPLDKDGSVNLTRHKYVLIFAAKHEVED